jgi:NADH-ubiquinone oxidoreductase chain 2
MAGIPPLMGFFAKYAVLYTAIHNGYYFISLIAIITSVISAAYYLRVVRVLYFDNPNTDLSRVSREHTIISSTHRYIIAALTIFIILFVLQPSLILNSTQLMAMSIYGY